jgi:large subunit ribosomal protein L14e
MVADIGRFCVKIAGRDAGKECLIVDTLDKGFVLIDGNTRRRKVNVAHLQLLPQKVEIKKGAAHEEVIKALESLGVKTEKKAPPKAKTEEKKSKATKAKKEAKA